MSARKYTNTAELVRLSGLSRERVQQYLKAKRIRGAYLAVSPDHVKGVWRIPLAGAEEFLAGRGIKVKRWAWDADTEAAIATARASLKAARKAAVWVAV